MSVFPFTQKGDGLFSTYTAYRRDTNFPAEGNFEIYPTSRTAIDSGSKEKYTIVPRLSAFLEVTEALRVRTLELIAVYQVAPASGVWHRDLSPSMIGEVLASDLVPQSELQDLLVLYRPEITAFRYELKPTFLERLAEHDIPENRLRDAVLLLARAGFPVQKVIDTMESTSQVGFNIEDGGIQIVDPHNFIDEHMGFPGLGKFSFSPGDWIKMKALMDN